MLNPRSVAAEDEEDRSEQDETEADEPTDPPDDAEEVSPPEDPEPESEEPPSDDMPSEDAAPKPESGPESEDAGAHEPAKASLPMPLIGGAIVAVVAGLVIWKGQGKADGPSPAPTTTSQSPVAALTSDEATLACPVFAVGPVPVDDAGPLGAAAGSVACETFFAYTGRDFEHHRSPAVLMGIEPHASDGPAPYGTDHRDQTVAAAKNATGWVDGKVTVGASDYTVEIRLMAGDAPLGPPGKATHASLQVASSDAAAAAAEAAGLKPVAKLPPALSSLFWSCPDGACFRDVMRLGLAIDAAPNPLELCRTMVKKHPSAAASVMNNHCAGPLRRAGDEVPTFEKLLSSVPEPLRTARLSMAGGAELPPADLAAKAKAAPDAGAKTIVKVAEALARATASDPEATKVADAIIEATPRICLARMVALYASPARDEAKRARSGATWCPETVSFWRSLHGEEETTPQQTVQAQRIAYALSGRGAGAALDYAQALLSEVHRDPKALSALKALADQWKNDTSLVGAYLAARISQLDGKLGAAEEALSKVVLAAPDFGHSHGSTATLSALMMGFELTGAGETLTASFLDRFVLADPPLLAPDAPVLPLLRLCTYAAKDKGLACIERLRVLTGQGLLEVEGGFPESYATGAELFLKGDATTAVETWRADIMDPRVRPHLRPEAFDRQKDPELANSIDAARGRLDGGVVCARHLRMARRAVAGDDMVLARRLAREVVEHLGAADVDIDGMDEMRKLAKPNE